MDRVLLIGEAPSKTSDPRRPLTGRCGRFLAELAGVTFDRYLEIADRRNLLPANPGKAPGGKGDSFPLAEARARAWAFGKVHAGRRVVFLGRRVAGAFRLEAPYLSWGPHEPFCRVLIFPHPSGVNRWWNAAERRLEAARTLRAALLPEESAGILSR